MLNSLRTASKISKALFAEDAEAAALIDRTGKILRANLNFTALIGATKGASAWATLPTPAASALAAALRGKRPAILLATLGAEATRRVLRLHLTPLPGTGALLRATDATREQDLEDQLAQAHRLQAVGELAGGIAHDFNNLLTAILGAAEDLAEPLQTAPEIARENLIQIQQSAQRGAALVRQLLAFSRQQTLQPRVIPLNDAVRNIATLLQRLLGANVVVKLNLEEPGRDVRIDPTQLDQVLINLAVNAGYAMKQGGTLTLASGRRLPLRPFKFGSEIVPPGRYVSLTVTDTGSGIPPDILPRIFEPFFTTRREAGGTGLGLSTVHGIIRQSGGYMAVESHPGQGTRFEILLPKYEGEPHPDPSPAAHTSPPPAPQDHLRTVLLVDDEAPVRKLAERVLAKAGWQVIAASSAEEALELAETDQSFGCIVSDVIMPGMDGPALVRHLRQSRPHLPAVLISGYADASLRDSLAATDITFLAKPFAMSELTTTLEQAIESFATRAN